MKPCRWFQFEFPGALSGELRAEQEACMRVHLESCSECSEELEHIRRLDWALVAHLPSPGRVREFQKEFLQTFDAERRVACRPPRLARTLFPPALLPLAAAAGFAGFLVWSTPVVAPDVVPIEPLAESTVADGPASEAVSVSDDLESAHAFPPGFGGSASELLAECATVEELDAREAAAVLPVEGNG